MLSHLSQLNKNGWPCATGIIHFCGHMISRDESGRFPNSHEQPLKRAVDHFFQNNQVSDSFGSLAAGADILIAESAIKHGVGLHLVFPYSIETFINNSVLPSGKNWVDRFDLLLKQAKSTTVVYQRQPKDEIISYAECTEVAMGLGLLAAAQTDSLYDAKQLVLWDGQTTDGKAGSYPDMLRWNSLGLQSFYYDTKLDITRKQQHLKVQDNRRQSLQLSKFNYLQHSNLAKNNFSIAAYQQQTPVVRIENPSDFFSHTKELTNNKAIVWDLDQDIFGALNCNASSGITDRCAGLLAFYIMQAQPVDFDSTVLEALGLINDLRIGGEK
jgi:hypothetical protein